MHERQVEGLFCATVGEVTPQVDILGPKKPPLPHHCMGCTPGYSWPTARAPALLYVDPTQSTETRIVRGLGWHNLPRERKGE